MTELIKWKRLVFHVGGYDPATPERVRARFVRELRRFERTWSVNASVSESELDVDKLAWNIETSGPNWRVHTRFQFVRWDDVMDTVHRRPMWQRIPLGLLTFVEFIAAGALWGYMRTNWRYAAFFLYPLLLFTFLAVIAGLAGLLIATSSGSGTLGVLTGSAAFIGLIHGPGQLLQLPALFDDWIFARAYVHRGDSVLEQRFDRLAQELSKAADSSDFDEVLVIGHSLGAVLSVDLLDRALKLEPALGRGGTPVAFVSVGSSILKIALHRGAERLRAALNRIALAPGLFWAEYQSLTDPMNFYKTNPMAALGLPATDQPVIRIVYFRQMLDPDAYRRIRRNFYRVHNQFISGNDRRAAYDYYMLLCGPVSIKRQVSLPTGVTTSVAEDGAVLTGPNHDKAARERSLPLVSNDAHAR
jgi:hypothetical protein